MPFTREPRRGGDFSGDADFGDSAPIGGTQLPGPQPAGGGAGGAGQQSNPGQTGGGALSDNPAFRNLPRDLQKRVESGELPIDEASGMFALRGGGTGGGGGGGTPVGGDTGAGGSNGNPSPPINATSVRPPSAEGTSAANPFVEAGETVEEQVGEATFARPGTRAFQPFAGSVVARNLRDPSEQRGIQLDRDVAAAGKRGDLSRTFSSGQGGGTLGDTLGAGNQDDLSQLILRQLGLE